MKKKKAPLGRRMKEYVRASVIWGPLDHNLFFTIIFLNVYGIIMVYSASYNNTITKNSNYFMMNQLKNVIFGLIVMLAVSYVNYHRFVRLGFGWFWLFLAFGIIGALKTPLARSELGATRWIRLGPISFQAAEPIKAAFIIFLAYYVKYVGLKTWKQQIALAAVSLPLLVLLFAVSNNLSAFIILFSIYIVIDMASIRKQDIPKHIICLIVAGIIAVIAYIIFSVIKNGSLENDFRIQRILAWISSEGQSSTDVAFQSLQAKYAIGAGGFWGKGLGQSLIKFKLPYSYNDFILAIICEELGVFGVILMMSLFGYLLYRVYKIAQNAWDIDGKILAIGVFMQIAVQLLINVMVVTSIIPTTGVTLPFFSAGGTSVVFLLAELGMILNVDKYAKERRFREEAERHVAQVEQRGGIGAAGWRRHLDSLRTHKG